MADQLDDPGVESNARLTASVAVVLVLLLAAEGVTILRIRGLLTAHMFIGLLLIPPVGVKIGSTGWRFARYYRGAAAYRRKGPPHPVLRVLGPFAVVATVVVFASGVALPLVAGTWSSRLLFVHKASFIGWIGIMVIHVLGHLFETVRLAPLDWSRRGRSEVPGAGARLSALLSSLAVGTLLALLLIGQLHYTRLYR